MTPDLFLELALAPALSLLPPVMDTPPARALVVAIALQESGLQHRRQIKGPARGYAQFERGGAVTGVLTHRASALHAIALCAVLDVPPTVAGVYGALEYQDVLAAGFARLLLWTDPKPLPTDPRRAWALYLRTWRPGRPHRETWDANFAAAWDLVAGASD